jgi:hypothetical protein
MRSSWKKDATIVHFRAGPRIGKDHGDNNAFRLIAFGYDLLPELEVPFWPLDKRGRESYAEREWIEGTPGHNTVLVDGVGQFSMWDKKYGWPAENRTRPGWLATPEEGVTPQAQVATFVATPLVDYVRGDASNAYYTRKEDKRLLEKFQRRLLFVKDEYLVVFDDIKSLVGMARDIQWIFHAGKDNKVEVLNKTFTIYPRKSFHELHLTVDVLAPEVAIEQQFVPVQQVSYRSPFVSIRQITPHNQVHGIFVFNIRNGRGARFEGSLVHHDTTAAVVRVGHDLIVWNKTSRPFQYDDLRFDGDVAWIRPKISALLIEGTSLEWRGKRLIDNQVKVSDVWMSGRTKR